METSTIIENKGDICPESLSKSIGRLNRLAQAENKIKPFKEKSPQAAINKKPRLHPVFEKACLYTDCSISPMAAFFGGIVAQEIVKKTGKYSPLK